MDDTVHVEIQIIKFEAVRVRSGDIYRNCVTTTRIGRFFFNDVANRLRVTVGEPSVERWNSHGRLGLAFFIGDEIDRDLNKACLSAKRN